MTGSNERVKSVFITVVIYRSKHERLYKKISDKIDKPYIVLSLLAQELQQVISLDPESKRKYCGKNERIRKEKLILEIQTNRKDVGGDDGNKSYQAD